MPIDRDIKRLLPPKPLLGLGLGLLLSLALVFATSPWLSGYSALWISPWLFALGYFLGQRARTHHSRHQIDQLKSRLAHEINNPLAIVMEQLGSAVGQLERTSQISGRERAAELRQLADAALGAAERIAHVVRSLDDTGTVSHERPTRMRSGPIPTPIRARILIIDDEPQVAASLKRILRRHEVEIATTGFEALNLIAQRSFDVILSDVMMPEPSGLDVYERVARSQPALARRFIFVSGGSYTARAKDFMANVPNARLAKPVDPVELEQEIARVHAGIEYGEEVG